MTAMLFHKQGHRQVIKCGEDNYGKCGARAYNGVLGASPQWDPEGEPPVKKPGGKDHLKLKYFCHV